MNYFISHQLRRIRTDLGYSQEYLALKLNISQSTYSEIENDHVAVSLNKLNKIAEILNKSPLELIQLNGKPLPLQGEDRDPKHMNLEFQTALIQQLSETLLKFINLLENKSKT